MGIHGAFRFHSVGQGLFYSGLLSKKDGKCREVFSFVYDCGSESPTRFLNGEIADYKLLLPSVNGKKKLNLLVVSHLHDDHINGLENLLQDVDVDNVVMPYVNDGLKLLARLESDRSNEFLQSFYVDPVAWFISKGVRRIFLLGSEETDQHRDTPESKLRNDLESEDLYVDSSILKLEKYEETTIVYLSNKATLSSYSFDWMFVFENLHEKSYRAERYVEIVENFKKKKFLTLDEIFKNKLLSKELKHELKSVFVGGDAINRTSVVLLHKPKDISGKRYISASLIRYHNWIYEIDFDYCGTLLTGDVRLKDDEHLEMLSQTDHNPCFVLQYPHHGAGNNNINYFCSLDAIVCLFSCGLTNRYGHPESDILEKWPRALVGVNERSAFDYQIYMV